MTTEHCSIFTVSWTILFVQKGKAGVESSGTKTKHAQKHETGRGNVRIQQYVLFLQQPYPLLQGIYI